MDFPPVKSCCERDDTKVLKGWEALVESLPMLMLTGAAVLWGMAPTQQTDDTDYSSLTARNMRLALTLTLGTN